MRNATNISIASIGHVVTSARLIVPDGQVVGEEPSQRPRIERQSLNRDC
jgi:hypothetical protein